MTSPANSQRVFHRCIPTMIRTLAFTEAQTAIIVYHAEQTARRLRIATPER